MFHGFNKFFIKYFIKIAYSNEVHKC
jgi:hypothetical protein